SLLDGGLDAFPEVGSVDRREAVELRLDLLEEHAQAGRFDEAAGEQLTHVLDVLRVIPLELRERLRVEVEMAERQAPFADCERATHATAARQQSVGGRCR